MKALVCGMLFCLVAAVPAEAGADEVSGFEARFEQTRVLPGLNRPFLAEGRLRWERGGRLDWHTERPVEYRYRLAPDGLVEIMPGGARRELDAEEAPWILSLNRLLAALVGGDENVLDELFESEAHPEQGCLLRPRDRALADLIERIHVVGKPFPDYLRIEEADGAYMEIRLFERRILEQGRDEA
jgi:hypothetical protein